MKVTVQLLGRLKMKLPDATKGLIELELPTGSTTHAVLERLHLPLDGSYYITRNGERIAPDGYGSEPLRTGDRLNITPPLAGG
jgi:sulfur carrier protein ThiS